MEKNYSRNQVLSKASDKKNSSDVSTKQFPKNRRRENQNNPKNQQPKYKNYNDKRPQKRGGSSNGSSDASQASSTGLDDPEFEAELHSVFVPGSKKQNLNHLLNFHYYNPRESDHSPTSNGVSHFPNHGFNRHYTKKCRYNKEQYLQANCQFIVKETGDYRAYKESPDILVDWDSIEQVIVNNGSGEEVACPICLYPPKAAKICRCGHIYCFSCVLHYLALSDKTWRKCPICYEAIHLKDLKSAVSKQNHFFKVGNTITFDLMRREKGSLYVSKASTEINQSPNEFPNFGDTAENLKHSKLILANNNEVLQIMEREKRELEFQLMENGEDCPESIFVQQAMEQILSQEQAILKSVNLESPSSIEEEGAMALPISLNPAASEFVPIAHKPEVTDEKHLFDEDCSLTLQDIDIVPTQSSTPSKYFYYYQSSDGQNMFLHSINSRMLQQMFGSLEKSPNKISGKIVQIESCSLNLDLRKRLKYLQHLPVTTQFDVVEIEFDDGVISNSVWNSFKDEVFHRRKFRQRREREERKREKHINEINDRQMGKILSRSANIDIKSTSHFPACFDGNSDDMPVLTKQSGPFADNATARSTSPGPRKKTGGGKTGPSFANMLTAQTARKSDLWPSLSSNETQSSAQAAPSYFADKFSGSQFVHATGAKNMLPTKPRLTSASQSSEDHQKSDDEDDNDSLYEMKVPAYKNNLGDALASALNSVHLNNSGTTEAKSSGKKKKTKKTLLFASGMSFGGM